MDTQENQLTVETSALAFGGSAIGTVSLPPQFAGKKALVPFAVPGETVTAEVTQDFGSIFDTKLVSVSSPSANRVEPPCPYFGQCGGCDLQHIELSTQRRLKRDMVETTLLHKGGVTPKEGVELVQTELPGLGYRRRIALHLNSEGELGFFKANSTTVQDIDQCLISSSSLNAALAELRTVASSLVPHVAGATLEEASNGVVLVAELSDKANIDSAVQLLRPLLSRFLGIKIRRRRETVKTLGDSSALSAAGSFSQVNDQANACLVDTVKSLVCSDRLYDLYAGSGNLSLPLAAAGHSVDAVELDRELVSVGRKIAKQRKLSDKISFHQLSVEHFLKSNTLKGTVLLDPPRSGAKGVVSRFSTKDIDEVIYVSCSISTLARDVRVLCESGFVLKKVFVIDMFPQTHHVETVSLLSANAA